MGSIETTKIEFCLLELRTGDGHEMPRAEFYSPQGLLTLEGYGFVERAASHTGIACAARLIGEYRDFMLVFNRLSPNEIERLKAPYQGEQCPTESELIKNHYLKLIDQFLDRLKGMVRGQPKNALLITHESARAATVANAAAKGSLPTEK